MKRFVEGADRGQSTLFPECLDEWVEESNSVRVIDCFVDSLDLADLGFEGVEPAATGRPAYHPSVLLKLYIYGYLNRVQSSRRLEREAGRNLEVIWLLGRLVPDDKVIADFRKDNGPAIRRVCARFVNLCPPSDLTSSRVIAQQWLSKNRRHQIIQKEQQLPTEARPVPARSIEGHDNLSSDLPRYGNISEAGIYGCRRVLP